MKNQKPNRRFIRRKGWQRGYWERIIRSEREFQATQKYILENSLRWQGVRDNLDKLLVKMRHVSG